MALSRIFVFLLFSFIAGVLVRSFVPIPYFPLIVILCIGACMFCVGIRSGRKKQLLFGFFIAVFCFGVIRLELSLSVPPVLSTAYDTHVALLGAVWAEPEEYATYQRLKIKITDMNGEKLSEEFFVLTTVRLYPGYAIGDRLFLTGVLEKPENYSDFNYVSYLAKNDIYATLFYPSIEKVSTDTKMSFFIALQRNLIFFKHAFLDKVERTIPEPHASFLAGLLTGERRSIPDELLNAFKRTGTMHIIALSGFNISIIAENLLFLLQFFLIPFSVSFWISVVFIALFTLMVGAGPSIVRAAIMGILVLIARKNFRMYDARIALLFAAAAMIVLNPKIARFDVGFQLSFAATAGLLFIAPKIRYFFAWITAPLVRETLVTTLSAQIAVLPLLILYFGGVSLISPLVNLAILLFIPTTMLVGFFAGAFGFFSLFLGSAFGIISWIFLQYEIFTVSFFSGMPFSYIELPQFFSVLFLCLYGFFLYRILRYKPHFNELS